MFGVAFIYASKREKYIYIYIYFLWESYILAINVMFSKYFITNELVLENLEALF